MNLNFDWRNLLAKTNFPGNPLTDTITFFYDPLRQRVKTRVRWSYCMLCGPAGASASPGTADSLLTRSLGGSPEAPAAAAPADCLPPDYCPNWHFATNYYIFDQFGRVVAEYDETVLKRLYYYGPTGRMSMRQLSTPPVLFHYLDDQIGSTRLLVKAASTDPGRIASSYDFYPYGETYQAMVTTPAKYLFTGQHFEDERNINLYYFGARYYNPALLRFISVDPAGQYFSPYLYGGGNPTIGADPNGEWFWTVLFLINLASQMARGYEQGGLGGMFQAGVVAGVIGGVSSVVSQAAFQGVLGNSVGFIDGMPDPAVSLSPWKDVLASTIGGAVGGAAGGALGSLVTNRPVLAGVGAGAATGAVYGAAASDPVESFASGRGFKTYRQGLNDVEGPELADAAMEKGVYGTNYQPAQHSWSVPGLGTVGEGSYDCASCVGDVARVAENYPNGFVREGVRQYGANTLNFHVDVRIGRSRGVDYVFGKTGASGRILVTPDFMIQRLYGPVTEFRPWNEVSYLRWR